MADAQTKIILTASDQTKAAFSSAAGNLKGLERSASNLRASLAGIAGGVTLGAFATFAKNTLDAADALNDMSQRTRVSVKDLASLRTVAEQSGTDLESVGKAIAKLNLSFSQAQGGSKEIAASLQRLGVNSSDARERFFQLADAYVKAGNDTRVLADLQKVLGKSYADMIPLLAQGGTELRRAAEASETFADAMARLAPEADKFNDNITELKTSAAGLTADFLTDFVPALNEIIKAMRAAYDESGFLKAAIVGLGGLGTAIFTDEFKSDLAKLEKLKKQLADVEGLPIPGLVASEAKRAEMRAEIARLEASIAAAQKAAAQAAKDSAPTPGKSSAGGNTTVRTPTDPLAGFFKATDAARLKEYNGLVADLLRRMAGAKGDTTVFVQALDEINKKFADINGMKEAAQQFDLGGGILGDIEDLQSYQEQMNEARASQAQFNDALTEAGRAIEEEFGNPMDALNKRMAYLDWLLEEGKISWEAWANASMAAADAVEDVGDKTEKTKDFGEQLGLVMESALGEAIRGGKDASDVFKALLQDILQLIAQVLILKPLMEGLDGKTSTGSNAISGFFNSVGKSIGDWAKNLFPFENGGIMSANGPLPLKKYASGGIASSPQLALFGEGSRPEAYVPLPDGRRIPVQMKGGGQRQVVNNIAITAANPTEVRLARGAHLADLSRALQHANRWA